MSRELEAQLSAALTAVQWERFKAFIGLEALLRDEFGIDIDISSALRSGARLEDVFAFARDEIRLIRILNWNPPDVL